MLNIIESNNIELFIVNIKIEYQNRFEKGSVLLIIRFYSIKAILCQNKLLDQ
jgi:hypothetical protein